MIAGMSTATAMAPAPPTLASLAAEPGWPLQAPAPLACTTGAPGLSADELRHFHERGWVLRRGLADAAAVAALSSECDGLHERFAAPGAEEATPGIGISWEEHADPAKPRRIRQLMGSQAVCPTLDAISRSEAVLAIMRQLIGPDVYLFHSKLMMKAAREGTFTPWHQDYQYWQYESILPTQVNCMLYIDGADLGNGCLRMVDGSHTRGLLPIHRIKSSSFSIGLEGSLDAWDSTPIPVQPGDAIFFGSYVVHGSGPNTSDRHRRANTFAFDRPLNVRPRDGIQGALPLDFHRCGKPDPRSLPG